MGAKVSGNESSRERKLSRTFVPVSERAGPLGSLRTGLKLEDTARINFGGLDVEVAWLWPWPQTSMV